MTVARDARAVLAPAAADRLLDWLVERVRLPMNEGGGGWTGGLDLLVKTYEYTGRSDAEWCPFERVAAGDAAVYPWKARIADRGEGQWKRCDILAVALWLPVHPDLPQGLTL